MDTSPPWNAELRSAHARPGTGSGQRLDGRYALVCLEHPRNSNGPPGRYCRWAELPDGTRQVSLRSNGYMGPGAPAGPYHHYTFELYALDTKLEVPQGTPQQTGETRTAVINAM